MANNFEQILALVNAGNQMGLSNTIKRDYGIPLDFTSVQSSFDDAVIYAATNTKAYVGQTLAVGDTLYIISSTAAATKHTVGEVEYDNYLKRVGTISTGDEASITVTSDGLVSMFGFATAENNKLPMKVDGAIVWRSLEDIGAGDGNDDTTYTFELNPAKNGIIVTPLFNGQPIMEGEEGDQTQKKFELVLDVYTKAEADEKFLAREDYTPYDDTALSDKVTALETTVNGKAESAEGAGDAVEGLVDKVAANAQAIADETDAREAAIEDITRAETGAIAVAISGEASARDAAIKVVSDKIGTVAEDTTVVDMIAAVEEQIPTVPTNVSEFNNDAGYLTEHQDISGKADKADTYTKTEVDTAIEDAKKSILGEGVEEAYNTLKEIQDILEGTDGEAIDGLVESVDANKQAIAILNGDTSTEGSVDKKISDAIAPLATTEALNEVKATAEAAQTAEQVSTAIESALTEANLDQYAKAQDVTDSLADKANTADVVSNETFEQFKTANTQAISDARTGAVEDVSKVGYALADDVARDYATKQELQDQSNTINTTLNDYAKTEDVDAELAKKIETGTISHAVAAVEADPENGIEAVEGIPEGVTVDGTTLKIVVDAPTRAETIKMIADKVADVTGGESAADVKLSLEAEVERSTAKDTAHDNAIATLQGAASVKGSVAEAKAAADAAQQTADDANTAITTLTNGQVKTNTDAITAVTGRLTNLETAKGDHETRIATAEGKIGSLETATANNASAIGALQGKDTELVAEDARLAGLITTLQSDKANASDVYTKGEVDTKVQEAIDAIPDVDLAPYAKTEDVNSALDTKANAADVYTKDEADLAFMTESEVDSRINALIVAADPEGGKTITDIQNLVKYVDENAGEIAALVTATDANTAKLAGIDTTVTAYVSDQLANIVQPKASDEISVAEDGTLGIVGMNVNKLVQTTGDTLIIDGGNTQ